MGEARRHCKLSRDHSFAAFDFYRVLTYTAVHCLTYVLVILIRLSLPIGMQIMFAIHSSNIQLGATVTIGRVDYIECHGRLGETARAATVYKCNVRT